MTLFFWLSLRSASLFDLDSSRFLAFSVSGKTFTGKYYQRQTPPPPKQACSRTYALCSRLPLRRRHGAFSVERYAPIGSVNCRSSSWHFQLLRTVCSSVSRAPSTHRRKALGEASAACCFGLLGLLLRASIARIDVGSECWSTRWRG